MSDDGRVTGRAGTRRGTITLLRICHKERPWIETALRNECIGGGLLPRAGCQAYRAAASGCQAGRDCADAGGAPAGGQPGAAAPGHRAWGETRHWSGVPPCTASSGRVGRREGHRSGARRSCASRRRVASRPARRPTRSSSSGSRSGRRTISSTRRWRSWGGLALLPPGDREERLKHIVQACHEVAEASGGLARMLGLGSGASGEEEALLEAISTTLRRHGGLEREARTEPSAS